MSWRVLHSCIHLTRWDIFLTFVFVRHSTISTTLSSILTVHRGGLLRHLWENLPFSGRFRSTVLKITDLVLCVWEIVVDVSRLLLEGVAVVMNMMYVSIFFFGKRSHCYPFRTSLEQKRCSEGTRKIRSIRIGSARISSLTLVLILSCGGNSVGVGTHYGLDGPGIEFRWGRDFTHKSRPALRPTQPPMQCLPRLLSRE